MEPLIVVTFVAALGFDYVNGFHDAANSIATVVTTRVLSPRLAVAWAAFFNFVAVFVLGTGVAMTVGKGVVNPESITVPVIFSALVGAIIWNVLTWWLGLPSSSSHALIGGLAGAVIAFKGWQLLNVGTILFIASFIVISPLIGMLLGMINQMVVFLLVRKGSPRTINRLFRRLQLVSAAIYSISHGTNDAQKTIGILFALLVAGGQLPPDAKHIPYWIIFVSYAVIAAGTLAGGVRIIRTMGSKLTKLDPMHGFCAETGGGVTILAVSHFGIPVSTTHTITGAIAGVGMTSGYKSVRWLVAARILWAWILTIPVAGLLAALFYLAYTAIF
ncbi:MAG: inorganic phosphate transporter [Acidobacteria bacterium]|nr:inorganic phosphate transporter [Acidobacteriota bacterium]